MIQTITKQDLINLGFQKATATKIIKEGKQRLINRGFTIYTNRSITTIPAVIAEEILGFEIHREE